MIKVTLNAFVFIICLFNNNSLIAKDELIAKNPIEKTDFKIFKDDFFFTEYKKMQSYFKDSGALQKCVNVEISKGGKAKQKTKKQKLKSGKKNKNKSKRRKGSRKK